MTDNGLSLLRRGWPAPQETTTSSKAGVRFRLRALNAAAVGNFMTNSYHPSHRHNRDTFERIDTHRLTLSAIADKPLNTEGSLSQWF